MSGSGHPAVKTGTKRTLFEKDLVRVIDLRLPPKAIEPEHSHPRFLVYALSAARVRVTSLPDGQVTEADVKPGDIFWKEPVTHIGENIGDTELHELIFEFKS
jgi:beta-alanine degradation protein BauB